MGGHWKSARRAGTLKTSCELRIPAGAGITGWSAAHRQALRVPNVAEDPRYIEGSANTRSELAVPLIYRNEVLGVLNVESEQTDAYTENHEEMLTTLAGSLAAIIANARLLARVRAQAETRAHRVRDFRQDPTRHRHPVRAGDHGQRTHESRRRTSTRRSRSRAGPQRAGTDKEEE